MTALANQCLHLLYLDQYRFLHLKNFTAPQLNEIT